MTFEDALPEVQLAREKPGRELLGIVWRGKLTVVIVFLLVSATVTIATLVTPPLFSAESSLVVRIGREYAYRPEVAGTESVRTASLAEMVNSEVEILSGHDLAQGVVRQLGVSALYPDVLAVEPDPERAIERGVLLFRQASTIHPVLESSVIKVAFEHPDPKLAAEAVNLLVERFTDKHVAVFGEESLGRFEAELAARASELARAEDALAAFKRVNGLSDLNQQRSLLLGRRVQLDQELHACEQQLAELRAAGAPEPAPVPAPLAQDAPAIQDQGAGSLALDAAACDRLVEQASQRLLDLELEERQLLRDYSASNRRVESVRAELEHVRAVLADAARRSRTQRVQSLELSCADFRRSQAELDAEIRTLDEQEKSLHQLERDLGTAEAAVATYRERADEARIGSELDREKQINVRVIERAAPPVVPVGLPRSLKIGLGAFIGLLAGAGSALLLDLFRAS